MQRRHRRAHQIVWVIVGPLLLLGTIAGLALRRPVPVQPAPAQLDDARTEDAAAHDREEAP